jgi:hypothetical protein
LIVPPENIDKEIAFLWNSGWSRNEISRVLHVGHNRVQRIANVNRFGTHEEKKKIRLGRIRKRTNELVEYEGKPRNETYHRVSERSKLGLEAKYDDSKYSDFIQGDRTYSP